MNDLLLRSGPVRSGRRRTPTHQPSLLLSEEYWSLTVVVARNNAEQI
jgi:hypothetical protein